MKRLRCAGRIFTYVTDRFSFITCIGCNRCNCHHKNSLLCRPHVIDECFVIEKAFDLFSLPKDDENEIETREFVQFGNESFLKFFVSAASTSTSTCSSTRQSPLLLLRWPHTPQALLETSPPSGPLLLERTGLGHSTRDFIPYSSPTETVSELHEKFVVFFKKEIRNQNIIFRRTFQKTVHCVGNKTLGISCI